MLVLQGFLILVAYLIPSLGLILEKNPPHGLLHNHYKMFLVISLLCSVTFFILSITTENKIFKALAILLFVGQIILLLLWNFSVGISIHGFI